MRLDAILHKTEKKGNKDEYKRQPPSIAAKERPYDLQIITPSESENIAELDIDLTKTKNHIEIINPAEELIPQAKKRRDTEENREQTDNKQVTNKEQTKNKQTTNQEQLINNPFSKNENWKQNGNTSVNKLKTNREQTESKIETNLPIFTPLTEIVGLQRSVLVLIYQECKKARSRITPPITLDHIAHQLQTSTGSIKMTLRRLVTKGCIIRGEFKNGRAGWTKYELLDTYYQDLLHLENESSTAIELGFGRNRTKNKVETNRQQIDNKSISQQGTELFSSSSSYINTTTKDTDSLTNNEWANIDIEPLKEIGFQKYHLEQIKNHGGLTIEEVQESINAFAFDLKTNNIENKLKGPPINYFMGIMRKRAPYIPPANYEDLQTQTLRLYLERKKSEQKIKENLEKEIFSLAYKDWESTLTEEEVSKIIPEPKYREIDGVFRQSILELYFRKTQWVEIQGEMKGKS